MKNLILFLILLTLPAPSPAGGSKADYERADRFRSDHSGKVRNERITPHWLGDGNRFWYRSSAADGSVQLFLVNPEEATREQIDRPPVEASQNGTTVKVLPALRQAGSEGPETAIRFLNRTAKPITVSWARRPDDLKPYGRIAAGEERTQHTYSGHLWVARDEAGKTLGIFEAIDGDGVAVIDGSHQPGTAPPAHQPPRHREGDHLAARHRGAKSPDGKWQASIQNHQLVITETTSGETRFLSGDGSADDAFAPPFHWSPDSSRLVVLQTGVAPKRRIHLIQSSPEDQLQPKLIEHSYNKPGDPLPKPKPRLFDVPAGREIPVDTKLFSDPWDLKQLLWDIDSKRFTFLYNERGHQRLRLIGIDAATGEASPVIEENPGTFVCYSSKSFYAPLDANDEIIWGSERDGWYHLYLFDRKTGHLKNQITRGEWVVRSIDRIDPEARQIWFQAGGMNPGEDPYHLHHYRIRFDGTGLVRLTEGDGCHELTYSPDGSCYLDTWSRVDHPPVHELRRSADGSLLMELEKADATALTQTNWERPERFTAKGRDGETDIYGVLFRPSTFDPSRKYPVVEQIYAGPHSAHVPKRWSSTHGGQVMAELGFIVVQIDGMGTSHRSKAFHDVCWQDLGDAGFPDRIAWIKAAAATRPWMDLSRVGIYGGSAGGQNAMRALIAHPDFYHVAVADCGCHDNRMDKIWWNEQWMGYPVGPHYEAASNVAQAHRLKGKLMLIVGELDKNVDPASTTQVVNALIEADKDFDYVLIPNAGHGAAGTPYGKRRQRDFLVRHLLGVEPRH